MTEQGSERPDKGKRVARPKKRQRQTPKYVPRVPAKLPTIAAPSPSFMGPPPTPTIQPPTPAMKVQWKPEHETQIQRNFHMKASHRLSEMFRDARNAEERPYWLGEQIWNSLLAHWNSVEFPNKCAKAQRNKASEKGGTLHTGGSITIHEHAIRMVNIHYFSVSFIYKLCIFYFICTRVTLNYVTGTSSGTGGPCL
ncbi:hypothetical protein LR48_Vigan05g078100 [Vigna angularis]|uniref:Uncharacterized protein n=1 Tax=Phaseolus angularis TaxID=3914 RepID=A0A0L9UKS8_PHAAN|nr:hypothetical protein LR48_Vigan05g078100 [Vigna angularis]